MLRRLVCAFAVLCTCGLLSATAHAQKQAPPNIVLIMTDDMGWSDVGVYGSRDIKTPNIDSLARDGVRFTEFYANGVLCTPTRAALISGRYQQRYRLEVALGNDNPKNPLQRGLPAFGHSLPRLLKRAGYATALVGKWHLGYRPEFSPLTHGFDYFFGLKSGYHDYYTHTDGNGQPDLWENDSPTKADGYMTDLITERAISFISRSAGGPFFVDVAYNAPHWPYQVPGKMSVAPRKGQHIMPHEPGASSRADYVAMVERVDHGVGRILNTLNKLGLAQNTIVVFTNDNGGEWLSDSGPLRSRKWTVWEGGIRVPTLVRWPQVLPAGTVSTQVGITMDLTMSILRAANAPVPTDARLEGLDVFSLSRERAPETHRTLFWRTAAGGRSQKAVRSGEWKLVVDGNHTHLYNVRKDPAERTDLVSVRQPFAAKLYSMLVQWEKDVDRESGWYLIQQLNAGSIAWPR